MGAVLLIGLGASNLAVVDFLTAAGVERFMLFDDRRDPATAATARARGIEVVDPADGLPPDASLVVPSPGVRRDHPVVRAARARLLNVRTEMAIAVDHWDGPLVAITGTNGKTTVTTLVTAMLQESGQRAVAAGNIGVPMLSVVGGGYDTIVAEVSSFQLDWLPEISPTVATWLNFAEDHIDWHGSVDAYRQAKAKLWSAMDYETSFAIVNADDPVVLDEARWVDAPRSEYSIESNGRGWCWDRSRDLLLGPGREPLIARSEMPRGLPIDVSNALAATATAFYAGATIEACVEVLRRFRGLPHRLERVTEIGGATYFDDSKSTTPASTLAACAAFPSVVLIAGGQNKGMDLTKLRDAAPTLRAVVAMGEAGPEVASALAGAVPVSLVESMEEAVDAARAVAEPGDTVLLSPACTSWDRYRSYAERGEHFASLVRALAPPADRGGALR